MNNNISKYLINKNSTIYNALERLNRLTFVLNLFVINEKGELVGSITDGDIRRSILKGSKLEDSITIAMNPKSKYLYYNNIDLGLIIEQRSLDIKILPIINEKKEVVQLLNFHEKRTILPIDSVVMAGGKGSRLLPLTQEVPKPLLKIGSKPILQYNLERFFKFGIDNVFLTVNYLKEKVVEYANNFNLEGLKIQCIEENKPLGTIGSLTLIKQWKNDDILLTNSDLLTNIDYEDFYVAFKKSEADLMVAVVPYIIKVPYAILETKDKNVISFKEKPEYVHHANTGIYLLKKEVVSLIPQDTFFNATDLIDKLIRLKRNVSYYPMLDYWLDIGKHDDFKKAQEDINYIKL